MKMAHNDFDSLSQNLLLTLHKRLERKKTNKKHFNWICDNIKGEKEWFE
jgi:hypothetical protein